jgi:hypothetical protein
MKIEDVQEADFRLANRLTPQGATAADNVGCEPATIAMCMCGASWICASIQPLDRSLWRQRENMVALQRCHPAAISGVGGQPLKPVNSIGLTVGAAPPGDLENDHH